ncbi:hypothetical protein BJV78DRAFT_470478 [Lactifluus subvellereus]|nr:hypothetical protein BJV78DRAFT_470478 [Lactifluus subvellereus]
MPVPVIHCIISMTTSFLAITPSGLDLALLGVATCPVTPILYNIVSPDRCLAHASADTNSPDTSPIRRCPPPGLVVIPGTECQLFSHYCKTSPQWLYPLDQTNPTFEPDVRHRPVLELSSRDPLAETLTASGPHVMSFRARRGPPVVTLGHRSPSCRRPLELKGHFQSVALLSLLLGYSPRPFTRGAIHRF